ncbi:MAG: hypothetical protein ACFFGZ_13360 [Candidatus Thorarchaeota archaeon]
MLDQILGAFEILEDTSLAKTIANGELDYQDGRIASLEQYLQGKRSED